MADDSTKRGERDSGRSRRAGPAIDTRAKWHAAVQAEHRMRRLLDLLPATDTEACEDCRRLAESYAAIAADYAVQLQAETAA
jgi:hypothetical protein